MHLTHKKSLKKVELKKLWAPKVEQVKNSKNKPSNTTNANSQTLEKFLVYYYDVIKVQDDL
jgi:hypothetical protein